MIDQNIGDEMYHWAKELYPICRSITGRGVRETLAYIKRIIPELVIHGVASGTQVFDWVVPEEWAVHDAYISDENGKRIVDFKEHNLHIVGYSVSVDVWVDLDELNKHLHSLPEQPNAIPYITSYYSRYWGFCLSHNQRNALLPGRYHVVINSEIKPGVLNYGEIILPGREGKEIFLSTYVCHPSMANNELSGPVVTAALVRWLIKQNNCRYTYRIVFIPETIGSIVYLSRHADKMKKMIVAGFNITCVGDDRAYSFMPSRTGLTLADRISQHVLRRSVQKFSYYSFLERGSDERQYCSPLIDLPVVSIMRSKYNTYPEYHTSLDDLTLISPTGLEGAFNLIKRCLCALEVCYTYRTVIQCEPQLGKRGLYPSLSTKLTNKKVRDMLNFMAYADGDSDLIEIAETIDVDVLDCAEIAERLLEHGLIERVCYS